MQRSTLVSLALSLVFILFTPQAAVAEDLTAAQLGALESAAVPLYPGSIYLTGDDSAATVMWFNSDDSPDKIMDWYKEQLGDWSELEWNGVRAIYKGPPGVDPSDLSP